VIRIEKKKGYTCKILVDKLKERDHLEDPSLDGRTILKQILKKEDEDRRTKAGYIWLSTGRNGGL
jgi:hypothetical protein